jgi:hypothetical protein
MRLILFISIIVFLASCKTEEDNYIKTTVQGYIRNSDNTPLPNYHFKIEGGGARYFLQSDQRGYFEYSFKASGTDHHIMSDEPTYATFWDGRIKSDTINVKSLYACPVGYIKSRFANVSTIDSDSVDYWIKMSAGCLSPYVIPPLRDYLFGSGVTLYVPFTNLDPLMSKGPSSGYTRCITRRFLQGNEVSTTIDSFWVNPGDTVHYLVTF